MDTAEIDRELDDVESRIDRLRSLYEQYFLGIEKMEPSIPRRDVERKMTILRKEQIRNTAQRFKFQMLVQRYNTMQQHWARVTREIENGTYRRDVARAAARFGEKEALTILGKKKQKQYAVLAEAQLAARAKRRGASGTDDELELSDSDLLVDDDDDDDDVPTGSSKRAPIATDDPGSSERKAQLGGLRWAGKNANDPASAVRSTEAQTGVKRRLAELAAAMKVPVPTSNDDPATPAPRAPSPAAIGSGVRPEAPGFGALDLDFDESAASQRSALLRKPGVVAAPITSAAISGSTSARPLPAAARPLPPMRPPAPSDAGGPRTPAPRSPQAAPPPRASGAEFGALDLPFDAPPAVVPAPLAPPRRPLPPPVVPAPRATAPAAPRPASPAAPPRPAGPPPVSAATPAPAPAVAQFSAAPPPPRPSAPAARPSAPVAEGALPDQRLRQIYAKYVEAKRSSNESTAGVTYEKLAETLRAQETRLKATHPAKSVDYDVVIKDGKALLKPVLR
jgi:hypothetical protein